jgi:hypothetical protein
MSNRTVLTLTDVLLQEGAQIHRERWKPARSAAGTSTTTHLYAEMHRLEQTALCLSGGGIRSAAFALGVMQAFAASPEGNGTKLLQQFNYLSTVSGGGYIGSWFTAWLSREQENDRVAAAGTNSGIAPLLPRPGAVTRVLNAMSRRANDVEPIQITNLRENTSYLTPHAGLLSGDMWAGIATIVRNVLLNWLVVLPLLVFGVLLAKLIAWGVFALRDGDDTAFHVLAAIAAIGLVLATAYRMANRPSLRIVNWPAAPFYLVHAPLAIVSALAIAMLVSRDAIALGKTYPTALDKTNIDWTAITAHYAVWGAALYLVAWTIPWAIGPGWRWIGRFRRRREGLPAGERTYRWTDWVWWVASGAIFGVLVALLERLSLGLTNPDWLLRALVIFGPPAIILAQMAGEICFVGLISRTQAEDDDREWFARSGGIYVLLALGGAVFFALVLLAPLAYDNLHDNARVLWTTLLGSVGGLTGLAGAFLGASQRTSPGGNGETKGNAPKRVPTELIVKTAAPVFGAVLVVAASLILDEIMFHGRFEQTGLFGNQTRLDVDMRIGQAALEALAWAFAASVSALWFIPLRININRFSIHAFYRNRLIRAFLAASRTEDGRELYRPRRNLFTDIDPDDNLAMHVLWNTLHPPRGESWRPFHVINMALNIVSTRNTAWQERKAEPFTVSPLHSGTGCITLDGPGKFQPTRSYGGAEDYGLSLGTAMAISGAAASPNMGYHSSPAVTFLMALFNVRLGWWLPNPGRKGRWQYHKLGPGWALRPYLDEMFGRTEDNRPFVYLSDGGHFENLGLYEMVRRRCRYIVVSDASQDKDFHFGSLANSVRKIGIDLGIRVEMRGLDALKKRSGERQTPGDRGPYHAIGLIHYADVDGKGTADGILLYIKPGLHWTEPVDVLNFAAMHGDFPHEMTGNQWFTESQFESYRRLGVSIAWPILERAAAEGQIFDRSPQGLAELLQVLAYQFPSWQL